MVAPGEVAVIHYVGRIATGEEAGAVFDTSDVDVAMAEGVYEAHRDFTPLSFEVGADEVLPGIDEAVRSMVPGEERTVTIEPAAAFGDREADRVVEVPREALESRSGRDARPWRIVQAATGEMGWITVVDEDTVTVDFNHDLAGTDLEFEIRLLEVHELDADGPSAA